MTTTTPATERVRNMFEIAEDTLQQFAFEKDPVYARAEERDGKYYIGTVYMTLEEAVKDQGPVTRRVNGRNVRVLDWASSVDIGNGECAILITPVTLKKYLPKYKG